MAVYADANATTAMPPEVIDAWVGAANLGDPLEGREETRQQVEALLEDFQQQTEELSGLRPGDFRLIHVSSAAEANVAIIEACVDAFWRTASQMPHVVVGATEPPSILQCVYRLQRSRRCRVSYATVDVTVGAPTPEIVQGCLRPNTCLVSISGAEALTGGLANLQKIGLACYTETNSARRGHVGAAARAAGRPERRRIPLHSDLSLFYPRTTTSLDALTLDAFSVSAHHMQGPPGFGFLAVRNGFVEGYGLQALVPGRMLNLPGLAASCAAHRLSLEDRGGKNARLAECIAGVVAVLGTVFRLHAYPGYPKESGAPNRGPRLKPPPELKRLAAACKGGEVLRTREVELGLVECGPADPSEGPVVVLLGPPPARRLPNTLLLAVWGVEFSGAELQAALQKSDPPVVARGYGEGDAMTLWALQIPRCLHGCVLRLSLADGTTKKLAQGLVTSLVASIKALAGR